MELNSSTAGREEQESKVREFMKKKEEELQRSCQVDENREGIVNESCFLRELLLSLFCSLAYAVPLRLLPLCRVHEEPGCPEGCRDPPQHM
jgi:hypothetical protein